MPTPSEHKALAFVAIVILLAGAVRVVRAGGLAGPEPSPLEQQGLARQAFAASSASVSPRSAKAAGKSKAGGKSAKGAKGPRSSGGAGATMLDSRGFPPPDPRVDIRWRTVDTATVAPAAGSRRRKPPAAPKPTGPVDLDSATEEEIETLPRVGPALAKRIVANRDSLGPFRSLNGLKRVRGIGPATISLLGPLVTFSRQTRP